MSGLTKHYGLVKPTVGGSENEWGGNLNDDLEKIDGLLGGDEVIYGINIQPNPANSDDDNETAIDGSVIVGGLGKNDLDYGDDEDPLVINDGVVISGKVKKLVGLPPEEGGGVITNCDVETRELAITESITEQVKVHIPADEITFKAKDGTMHYLSALDDEQEITLTITSGQAITLMLGWANKDRPPTSMVWNNAIKWVGGGSPDITLGTNIIQIWCVNWGQGDIIFGAGAGAAS